VKEETGMAHWLLQCNPDRYDTDHPAWLTGWSFAQQGLAAKLNPGDQVVIWLSGKGLSNQGAGVYATAKVADGEPYETETDTGFKQAEDVGRPVWCVDLLDGRRLDRPVLKSTLKADQRFADAMILKIPGKANPFPVTDEEWDAISSRF
jgi:predicted RNA-binding protein with PUA-like domain